MTGRQLWYIIEIAKEGNITTTAQKLHISQPSLSSLLAHVEEELGAKLFDRSVSPLVLTYAGEKYIEAANKVLSTMDELQSLVDDIEESHKGRLRIGCGPYHSPFFIPQVLPNMIRRYPEVEFYITEGMRPLLESELLAGRLDVLVYGGMNDNPILKYEKLIEQEYILMAPHGYKAALLRVPKEGAFPCIDLRSLKDVNFVLMNKGHQLRVMQDRVLHELKHKPKIILETDNWLTSLRMVESGIAFSIMPNKDTGFREQNFDVYSFEKKFYRRIYLCYRQNAYISKIMEDFMIMTRQMFQRV
jgi:DNA-binding transcriptional LysR family regulator